MSAALAARSPGTFPPAKSVVFAGCEGAMGACGASPSYSVAQSRMTFPDLPDPIVSNPFRYS
jgi:hypothetical protein